MQPDLFSGPVQRNDSYRLLARLAHGGRVPAPARRWSLDPTQRRRLAAGAGLLALAVVAWAWLQAGHGPERAVPTATAQDAAPVPWPPQVDAPPSQAAMIVSQPETPPVHQEEAAAPAPRLAPEPHTARARPSRPGHAQVAAPSETPRNRRSAGPAENDEDVTLLAAMLKHAKPPKAPATPPQKEQ